MRREIIAAGVAIAVLLALGACIVWIAHPPSTPALAPTQVGHPAAMNDAADTPVTVSARVERMPRQEAGSKEPPGETDWWSVDLATALPSMQAAARKGDTTAAHGLGLQLASCLQAIRDPSGDYARESWRDHPGHEQLLRVLAQHEACLAVGAAEVLRYHEWLELAARNGDIHAMSAYAQTAFDGFETHADLIGNLDEVIRRRDLARLWVDQALRLGNEQAISVLADNYFNDRGLFPRDNTQGISYEILRDLVIARRLGDDARFEHAWNGTEPRWAGFLEESQQVAALAQARQLYTDYFSKPTPP